MTLFNQLYAWGCGDWPTLRQVRTGRLVTVASLHEAPLAYAIVNFDDGDSLAVPSHELDTDYQYAIDPLHRQG